MAAAAKSHWSPKPNGPGVSQQCQQRQSSLSASSTSGEGGEGGEGFSQLQPAACSPRRLDKQTCVDKAARQWDKTKPSGQHMLRRMLGR